MRTAVAIVTGIAIGVAAAGAIYVAVQPPTERLARFGAAPSSAVASPQGQPHPVDEASPAQVANAVGPVSHPSRSVPVTPDYGPPAEATRPIYRCRSASGTTYSNEPCAGASVVDAANAVDGYDSRPSDRLAQLVANGRGAVDGPAGSVARANVAPVRESVECANFRRQIRDIDAASSRPNTIETLDQWRRIRQDIRTSMARNRC